MRKSKKTDSQVEADKRGKERIKQYQNRKDKEAEKSVKETLVTKYIIAYQNKDDAGWVPLYNK